MNLMQTLFSGDLDALRGEFGDGVDLPEFSALLQRHMPRMRGGHAAPDPRGAQLEMERLFASIDCDGDGAVTWDEVYTHAIETTMLHLQPKPFDRIRPYATRQAVPLADPAPHLMRYIPQLDLVCAGGRRSRLQLLHPGDFTVAASVREKEGGGATANPSQTEDEATAFVPSAALNAPPAVPITSVAYVSTAGSLLAFSNDMQLRSYALVDTSLLPGMPIPCDYYHSQIKTTERRPGLAFASTTSGAILVYEAQRYHPPHLRQTIPVHAEEGAASSALRGVSVGSLFGGSVPSGAPRRATSSDINQALSVMLPAGREGPHPPGSSSRGIITDFCFLTPYDRRVVTAAFDQTLRLTDLDHAPGGSRRGVTTIGASDTVLHTLDYAEGHQLIIAGGFDHSVSAWAPHVSHSPRTLFTDSQHQHRHKLVGVHAVQGTPQVLSVDSGSLVKVWDVRTFRCVQSFYVGENPSDTAVEGMELLPAFGLGGKVAAAAKTTAACYLPRKNQIACADTRGVLLHEYAHGTDSTTADDKYPVLHVVYSQSHGTAITVTARTLAAWDATAGVLHTLHERPMHADMTVATTDTHCRRLFVGSADGRVSVWGLAGGLVRLREFRAHPTEVTALALLERAQSLFAASVGGHVMVVLEKEPGMPHNRARLGTARIHTVGYAPGTEVLLCGALSGRVYVLDAAHPTVTLGEVHDGAAVSCVRPLGALPLFAVGYADGRVGIYTCRPAVDVVRVMAFSLVRAPRESPLQHMSPAKVSAAVAALLDADPSAGSTVDDDLFHDTQHPAVMRFDAASHVLWVGDSHGRITGWRLCPLLHYLGVAPSSMSDPPLSLRAIRSPIRPECVRTIEAHPDEVLSMDIAPDAGAVLTTSEDCRAVFWAYSGEYVGELSCGRGDEPAAPALGAPKSKSRRGSMPQFSLTRSAPPAVPMGRCRHRYPGRRQTMAAYLALGGDGTTPRAGVLAQDRPEPRRDTPTSRRRTELHLSDTDDDSHGPAPSAGVVEEGKSVAPRAALIVESEGPSSNETTVQAPIRPGLAPLHRVGKGHVVRQGGRVSGQSMWAGSVAVADLTGTMRAALVAEPPPEQNPKRRRRRHGSPQKGSPCSPDVAAMASPSRGPAPDLGLASPSGLPPRLVVVPGEPVDPDSGSSTEGTDTDSTDSTGPGPGEAPLGPPPGDRRPQRGPYDRSVPLLLQLNAQVRLESPRRAPGLARPAVPLSARAPGGWARPTPRPPSHGTFADQARRLAPERAEPPATARGQDRGFGLFTAKARETGPRPHSQPSIRRGPPLTAASASGSFGTPQAHGSSPMAVRPPLVARARR